MILTDTGPLVALCDPRDARHRDAISHLARLAPAGLRTCEPVLVEACFHLPNRAQRARLQAVLTDLRIDVLAPSHAGLHEDVLAWLLEYSDHQPDWADGCLAVLSGRDPRLRVWTYDREFRTTWRRPDGTAIPLAVRG
jgi:hypothetical protein